MTSNGSHSDQQLEVYY